MASPREMTARAARTLTTTSRLGRLLRARRLWRPLVVPAAGVALLLTASCGPIVVGPQPMLERAEAVVVLGNRPPVDRQGRVQPETYRRVKQGVALWYRGLAPILVMTGGPAPYGVVEADIMRDLAVRWGVPSERIVRERRSQNTIENARQTVALLCAKRPAAPPASCEPRIIVVSSPYHLRRARTLFQCAGARVQLAASAYPDSEATRRSALWHERIVRLAYAFFDPCRRAALPERPSHSALDAR